MNQISSWALGTVPSVPMGKNETEFCGTIPQNEKVETNYKKARTSPCEFNKDFLFGVA